MERRRIVINFKNNAEEIALYEELKKHSGISGYVKDILRGLINHNPVEVTMSKLTRVENTPEDDEINSILGI